MKDNYDTKKEIETNRELIRKLYNYVSDNKYNITKADVYSKALVHVATFDPFALYSEKLVDECLNQNVDDIVKKQLINVNNLLNDYEPYSCSSISYLEDFKKTHEGYNLVYDDYNHLYIDNACKLGTYIVGQSPIVADVLSDPYKYSRNTIVIVSEYLKEIIKKDEVAREYANEELEDYDYEDDDDDYFEDCESECSCDCEYCKLNKFNN